LQYLRNSRINGKKAEREKVREQVAARLGTLPDTISLKCADCRLIEWTTVDAIVTDPPWADLECYRWLAGMATDKLRDGGLLLLQCGTSLLADVIRIVCGAGLVYNWTLAFGYAETRRARPTAGRWLSAWNPVLVLSKGELRLTDAVGDFYLVQYARDSKDLHDWAQPEKPFAYWMKVMIPPGSLVADPFTGSGTTAVVCKQVALRFVGTEIDRKAYRVAVGRLNSPPPI
jgi:site-specific DNA-methyltransferase (adenine-specific)